MRRLQVVAARSPSRDFDQLIDQAIWNRIGLEVPGRAPAEGNPSESS
jgi:hypothetical protein